jgi:hypothetical protein
MINKCQSHHGTEWLQRVTGRKLCSPGNLRKLDVSMGLRSIRHLLHFVKNNDNHSDPVTHSRTSC